MESLGAALDSQFRASVGCEKAQNCDHQRENFSRHCLLMAVGGAADFFCLKTGACESEVLSPSRFDWVA